MKKIDHTMTMAQFLDYQRRLEQAVDEDVRNALRTILRLAQVTNPLVVTIQR